MKVRLNQLHLGCLLLGLTGLILVTGPVHANVCAHDAAPAASLLFPFVAFDYANPESGLTTLLAITNVSAEAQIVNLTLWSDTSQRVLSFYLVLSGYDLHTINIRDILHYGSLPVTGTSGEVAVSGSYDPIAEGPVSELHGSWLYHSLLRPESTEELAISCPPTWEHSPHRYASGLDEAELETIALQLQASQLAVKLHSRCATGDTYSLTPSDWWDLRDTSQPTWFYVTADVVLACDGLFPDQPEYWQEQAIVVSNVLTGDVIWIDDANDFAQADKAVHLEADRNIDQVATLDELGQPITFYYRYSTRNQGLSDFREPLPTAWAFRYIGADNPAIDTHVRAWKGSTFQLTPDDLSITDTWYLALDCLAYSYWAWDEDEQVSELIGSAPPPGVAWVYPNLFPLATQEVLVDELETPGADGWLLFAWPDANFGDIPGADEAPDRYQTWMGVRYSAHGRFSAFMEGTVAGNSNCFSDQVLPKLGIDYDYVTSPGGYVSSHQPPTGDINTHKYKN
jgi:hypothetical protein